MIEIEQLLKDVGQDKCDNLSTTSFNFKRDIWRFFNNKKYQNLIACEFGTHKGQTTYILSHLFQKVYTINRNEESLVEARNFNSTRGNIIYLPFNLYGEKLDYNPIQEEIGVFFIDAGHEYNQVDSDLRRIDVMKDKREVFVIFDDFGLIKDVHDCILDWMDDGRLEIIKHIGHEPGYDFGQGRILKDFEGIICKFK